MQPTGRQLTYRDITPELEIDLVRRCQAGDSAAGGVLVTANDRLIYRTVMRYFGKGLPVEDVVQSARLGYFEGIIHFESTAGVRLNTYALYWAIKGAHDALQKAGSTIRLPKRVHEAIYRATANASMGDELAERQRLLYPLSLDAPAGHDGGTIGDQTPGGGPLPDDAVADGEAQRRREELIQRALTWLTARQREVIERHLLTEDPEPFELIGASLGVTKQGAEELQKRAKAKLRQALQIIAAPDDAVLWGGDIPEGPMRRRVPKPAPKLAQAAPRAKPVRRKAPEQAAAIRPLRPHKAAAVAAKHG